MLTVDFDLLGVKKGQLALDAGCGTGRHSFEFLARGAEVLGMDMDMESVRKARYTMAVMMGNGQAHPEGRCQVHLGDALRLPFRDATFDRIICSEVMEHVDDDELAARELTRVLKPGGRIAVTVPTYISEWMFDALTYEYFTSPGGHVRKYVPRRLVAILNRQGLDVYAVDFRHALHTVYWMIRCVVGLHLENQPLTRGYRTFLTYGMGSRFMERFEGLLDNLFPKSVILYAVKK